MSPDDDVRLADPSAVFRRYRNSWYSVSTAYWARQEASVDGMLGGFPELSGIDVAASRDTVERYQRAGMGSARVADCGAGIGRVSHYVLSDFFRAIDLVDPVPAFLERAAESLRGDRVECRTAVCGIQEWAPEGQYDAFWVQWALMYLTDSDAVAFLRRCREHLGPNGRVFVKDNISSADLGQRRDGATFFPEDRGVCRVYAHFLALFEEAGLTLEEAQAQPEWPVDLLPLYTFVLK